MRSYVEPANGRMWPSSSGGFFSYDCHATMHEQAGRILEKLTGKDNSRRVSADASPLKFKEKFGYSRGNAASNFFFRVFNII